MKIIPTLLTVAFLLSGCQLDERGLDWRDNDHVTRVYVDPLIPTDLAMNGCEAWAAVGVRCLLVSSPQDALIGVFPTDAPDCKEDSEGNLWVGQGGWYDGPRPWYRVYLRAACFAFPVNWPSVSAHEFGHALGMPHVDTSRALMEPVNFPDSPAVLTDADVAAWNQLYGSTWQ